MENDVKYYPLTHPQKGIWYTEKLYPGTSINNIAATLRIEDSFDFNLLEKSINLVIQKNDALRLRFIESQGEPLQYLTEYKHESIDFFDFSENNIEALYDWDTKQTQVPFNLIDSKLYYFAILKISNNEFGIYSKINHLISDGWSIVQAGNWIVDNYYTLKNGLNIEADNNRSYIDFIKDEQQYLNSDRFIKDGEYWGSQFNSFEEISMVKNSSANHGLRAKRKTFVIPNKFSTLIRQYCRDNNTSIFSLFMPALCIYINRITSKEDITIGVPVLNRTNSKEKNTLGMFVSTVPLRIKLKENINFNGLSQEMTNLWFSALRHQKFPYEYILKKARENNKNIEKLYDISLSYQNAKFVKNDSHKQEGRWHFNGYQAESLYIHINDREDDGNIILDFDYNCDIFKAKEIEFMYDHITRLLWHALDNPNKKLPYIEMMSEKEKHKILNEFNDTYADYPQDKTISRLFEEQVKRTPNNIALVFEDKSMTYAELNNRSNQLARRLQELGVKPNDIVGIMVKRSFEMMISILAVLKAGGAYLPIDPEYPVNRIDYMLEDSKTSILLTDESHIHIDNHIKNRINVFDFIQSDDDLIDFESNNVSSDIAYLIYTSGSTGRPKGVAVENKSVINFITAMTKIIDFNSTKIIASFTTICFDIFVLETILPLTIGLKVIIANEKQQKLPEFMRDLLIKNKVNIMQTTPSRLKILLNGIGNNNYFNHLSDILIGGEPFPKTAFEQLTSMTNANIYNMYGPTETTVWSTVKKIKDTKFINIGKPIINTQVYILDKHLLPVPIGIPGELYIGGDGLSRGYYGKPDLTNNKFIKNPFNPEEKIYNTGDLARWYPQGEIEHLGRVDNQIKVNGFRIELSEIEQRLLQYKYIKEAVVTNEINVSGNSYLCAYYVSEKELAASELKIFLLSDLPYYMIPTYFIQLDCMPTTPNGKIDKLSLPKPKIGIANILQDNINDGKCRNEIDKKLLDIWIEIFKKDNIRINDNFFELGGDSLRIIQIQSILIKYDININTQDIYKYQTIKELSDMIALKKVKINEKIYDCKHVNLLESNIVDNKEIKLERNNNSILLLGATGYLGIHLLKDIIKNTQCNIYCIIRGESKEAAEKRLKKLFIYYFNGMLINEINERIFIINGDVTEMKFGLSSNEYNKLSKIIKIVVNSAALVKHYGFYEDFYKFNVKSIENIIEFCMNSKSILHHMSTMSIFGNYLDGNENLVRKYTENDFYIRQTNHENVYIRSKLESEQLIFNYVKKGLKAAIYRIGILSGRYSDGLFQKNIEENALYQKIKSIIELGIIPESLSNIEIEFTPVDYCSSAIEKLMFLKIDKCKVYHVFNNNLITIDNMIKAIETYGYKVRLVKDGNFAKKIKNKSLTTNNAVSGIVNDLKNESLQYERSNQVDSQLTIEKLSILKFKWPTITKNYIIKLLNFMVNTNFLNKIKENVDAQNKKLV